jgi:hypothetical protein
VPGGCDLLVSTDEDPAGGDAQAVWRQADDLGARHVLSLRAAAPAAAPAGWRMIARHRSWLRAGHVEILWGRE